jgi:O-antigen ligase
MSMYQSMAPSTADDYAIYPNAVAMEPQTATPQPQPSRTAHRGRRPEFYKPFHFLLLVYLFFYCSRIPEMVPWLHVGLLLQPMLLIGMIMTGTTKAIFKTDIGRVMTLFTVWVAICVPFSTWRGGSYQIFILALQAMGLLFFMAAFIRSLDDCYRVIYVMALAVAAIGLMSFVSHGSNMNDPRLGLGDARNNTLGDANILALYLVVGLPFLWFSSTWKKGIVKIGLLLLMAPVLIAMARTGSRMGLLALGLGTIFFLIFASASQRAVIILGGFVCLVLAVFLLPARITERFTTLFNPSTRASEEAAESAQARQAMLIRSIQLTLEHPLVGVGPGEFMDAEAAEDMAMGKRGMWHYTHNAYTELSSETGIPGMVIFLIAFWRSYKGLTPYRSRFPSQRVRRAALCIQIAVLVSAVGAFFLSIAYSGILYAIMGISAAFQLAASQQFKAIKAESQGAVATT